jgi:hypothetical protein
MMPWRARLSIASLRCQGVRRITDASLLFMRVVREQDRFLHTCLRVCLPCLAPLSAFRRVIVNQPLSSEPFWISYCMRTVRTFPLPHTREPS